MLLEDEALISKFIGLNTTDASLPKLKLPDRAASSTNWARCMLLRIITDRVVVDEQLGKMMMKAWATHRDTVIKPVDKNCYLMEFVEDEDMLKV